MNAYDDELATQLTATLHHESDVMTGSSLALGAVQGRARSIRRRQRATAVAGVAMAVAVIVPVASMATHTSGRPEPSPATQGPTPPTPPTPPPSATRADSRQPLDVAALETGAAAAPGVLVHDVVSGADGSSSAAPAGLDVNRFAMLADGTDVYLSLNPSSRVVVVDADGRRHGPYPASDGLVTDASRSSAAWVSPQGVVEVWRSGLGHPAALGTPVSGASPQAVSFWGDCSADSCGVLLTTTDSSGDPTSWIASADGTTRPADPGHRFVAVTDVDGQGDEIGLTKTAGDGSTCSGLAPHASAPTFTTCDHLLAGFSPDGNAVYALSSTLDGAGSPDIAAYDREGHLLFDHASSRSGHAFVQTVTWEDSTHLLGTVFQDGAWHVVRFGLDGSMQLAAPAVKGDVAFSAIQLPGSR